MVRPISFKLTNADVIVYLFNTFYTVSLYLKPVSVHFKIRFVARDEMADRFNLPKRLASLGVRLLSQSARLFEASDPNQPITVALSPGGRHARSPKYKHGDH